MKATVAAALALAAVYIAVGIGALAHQWGCVALHVWRGVRPTGGT